MGIKRLFNLEQWLIFIRKNKNYSRLYRNWVRHNFDRRYSPSIDRISTTGRNRHYSFKNIRVVTTSENIIRAWKIK